MGEKEEGKEEKYEYTRMMGEISGMGGNYEAGCRAMVRAGVKWLEEHPLSDPQFRGFKNVFGLIEEENDDAKALTEAMMNAPFIDDDGNPTTVRKYGATGAMHHACVQHLLFIKKNGWNEYVRQMSDRRDDDTTH